MTEILLAFKAGRAFRREGTNFVDPSPNKGAIIVTNGEDGLLHFTWKDRTTNQVEEVGNPRCYPSISFTIDILRISFSFRVMRLLLKWLLQAELMFSSSRRLIKGIS